MANTEAKTDDLDNSSLRIMDLNANKDYYHFSGLRQFHRYQRKMNVSRMERKKQELYPRHSFGG